MQIFIERLRELRTEMGMSQKELARLLNTTNSSVCDWERGRVGTQPRDGGADRPQVRGFGGLSARAGGRVRRKAIERTAPQ